MWAKMKGTELVRARIEGDFDWIGLAEQEYADWMADDLRLGLFPAEVPKGLNSCKEESRKTPTLLEIKSLQLARRKLETRGKEW